MKTNNGKTATKRNTSKTQKTYIKDTTGSSSTNQLQFF
jgi:hypothetical protein